MRLFILLLSWPLLLALAVAVPADLTDRTDLIARGLTNAVPLVEGPNDTNIAKVVTAILENAHYLKQPFNDEISAKFLDRYLDALDNLHIYFLQSDLERTKRFVRISKNMDKWLMASSHAMAWL